jgi:hypothetical protein
LDLFVSEEGTKIPLVYELDEAGYIQLQGKSSTLLADLSPALLNACLKELEKSRILRRSERELEVAHDTLAALIDAQRSAELRQLRELRRRIEAAYGEHKDSGGTHYLDAGQLARIEPFLDKIQLEPGWLGFLNESRREIERKAREDQERVERELAQAQTHLRRQRVFITLISLALLASVVLGYMVRMQSAQLRETNTLIANQKDSIQNQKDSIQGNLDRKNKLLLEIQLSEYHRLRPEILDSWRRALTLEKEGYQDQARDIKKESCALMEDAESNPLLKSLRDSLQCMNLK